MNGVLIITNSACNCGGRFSGVDIPQHWPCSAAFQIHKKESKKRINNMTTFSLKTGQARIEKRVKTKHYMLRK